jgi:hypothetical protein
MKQGACCDVPAEGFGCLSPVLIDGHDFIVAAANDGDATPAEISSLRLASTKCHDRAAGSLRDCRQNASS